MAALILPSRRVVQPQGAAEIDWANSIAKDLAYLFAAGGSRSDAARKLQPLLGGTPVFGATERGFALSASTPPYIPNGPGLILPIKHTVFGWIKPSTTADQMILQAGQNSLEYAAYSLKIGVCDAGGVTGKFNYSARRASGDPYSNTVSQASSIEVGKWYFAAATHDGVTLSLYLNGRLEAAVTGAGDAPNSTFAARLYVGGDNNASFTGARYIASGPLQNIGAVRRCLSACEIASLYANPWQLFKPQPARLWSASASVTLPTIVYPDSTTSAGSWTATGAASLHAAISEVTPSDTEYISVDVGSSCTFTLQEPAYPGTANQTIAYRAASTTSSALTVRLFQGATTITERTHSLTSDITLYTQMLTAGEISLITAGPLSVTLTAS